MQLEEATAVAHTDITDGPTTEELSNEMEQIRTGAHHVVEKRGFRDTKFYCHVLQETHTIRRPREYPYYTYSCGGGY